MQLSQNFILNWWKQRFQHLPTAKVHLLLAVSGGVDSVVLTDLVANAGIDFSILHCNFQLRGDESNDDEQFVRKLAVKYGKQIEVKHFDTEQLAVERKLSIQELARELRYKWFREIKSSLETTHPDKIYKIAVAHHADDNIETVLMHLFRGTGLNGLTGMDDCRNDLIRPLLNFRKETLVAYAETNGLTYREDSSNLKSDYTRNYFRNEWIPAVKNIFPNVEGNLLHTIARLKETDIIYRNAINGIIQKMVTVKGEELHIPVLLWKKANPIFTITFELLKDYGFSAAQTAEAIKLLDGDNSSYIHSSTHRLIKNRNWMIIAPLADTYEPVLIPIEKGSDKVAFSLGSLQLSVTNNSAISAEPDMAVINAALLTFPLILRPWKQGDYFYPLGMSKKKKISRFLADLKLSKTDKEKVWVLESNKKIVWVLGMRIDNRFRITDSTTDFLCITYLK